MTIIIYNKQNIIMYVYCIQIIIYILKNGTIAAPESEISGTGLE